MSRIILAFACFFSVLFRGRLPNRALELLPEGEGEAPPTPAPPQRTLTTVPDLPIAQARNTGPAMATAGVAVGAAAIAVTPIPARFPGARVADAADHRSEGALLVLGLLQREGRLVDFLRESLDEHADAAIGAAVRDIHRGCKKVLEEHLRLEPVMPGREEGPVVVPRGFDPTEVRLIGKTSGDPPFRGILVHHGWRAVDVKLPTLSDGVDRRVLAPAEVRLG
jgi:hypothetical protein